MTASRVRGLYAVTPDDDDTERLVARVEAALAGGATLVQYRHKTAGPALRREQATRLAALCARHDRLFIVNDHVDLAVAIAGAGLHVGRDDGDDLAAVRARLGPRRVLGVSCYGDLARARAAAAAGADYVAFGSVFVSPTKPFAPRVPLTLFGQARDIGIPTVGIGGITRANLPSLIEAGADAAAVIADLFDDPAPAATRSRAARLSGCFVPSTSHPS